MVKVTKDGKVKQSMVRRHEVLDLSIEDNLVV